MGLGLILVLGFLLLLLVLVIGAGVMLFDLSGRREEDAEWLQRKILDRLCRDPVLCKLRILPVVHVPASRHATVGVELSGEVPSKTSRDAVLDIARETALKLRRDIEIDDRLVVGRPAGARVA